LTKIYFQAEIFQAFAKEVGCLVLTNKAKQTTRFVSSLMRGLRTAAQNLPTIVKIYAEKCALNNKNADAKLILKTLDKLRDPGVLVHLCGILQLLEEYVAMSLTAQSSSNTPTEVWMMVLETKEELARLSRSWEWKTNDLKISCLEASAGGHLQAKDPKNQCQILQAARGSWFD
jgi:hypothetical protein